ncbi:MAG: tRNA (adenosine(37)-N6)-threonylcarbamoyltransferase complex ATPase subunit type 1 TsaE [Clostridiales bacterium]|mgnify:CR=1 FL=1|nr:tRNA (adenosine(37)-N6)-threonylcarbamoyltransferase complex ATPase subunit type 1 TsaE [Clostridiales bacterium]
MRFQTRSEADTRKFGAALGTLLHPGDAVLLSGELGVGKSVLARGIASALGVVGPMPSPTFTLVIPYEGTVPLYHLDLYRLSDPDEFFAAGLDEWIGGDGISVVEWPERAELSPEPSVRLKLSRTPDEGERAIGMECFGMSPDTSALDRWRTDA